MNSSFFDLMTFSIEVKEKWLGKDFRTSFVDFSTAAKDNQRGNEYMSGEGRRGKAGEGT